jgi:ubiquinone/menaquinone biosynthesis C-methylase UbiE
MNGASEGDGLTYWIRGEDCCDPVWEAAYNRFESADEERAKFRRRLLSMGVDTLPQSLRVADLFCGRGNNLAVLEELGFGDIVGVDLSPNLLRLYKGRAKLYVGDCRKMSLPDSSRDLVLVQGGLHHLPVLPDDLDHCFSEIRRILTPDGVVIFIEPWMTPFLWLAHTCCRSWLLRKINPKLDALAVMIDHERTTYEAWLRQPDQIRKVASEHFEPIVDRARMGKWFFMGRAKGQ